MRVVADTNVIVSAMLWIGSPHRILVAAEDDRLTLYTSPALLRELTGVLTRPKFASRLRELQVSASGVLSLTTQRMMKCLLVRWPREPTIL
jgi:putative PIN family toxin of toxin-antitoxin system